ncbi:hypothetical protein LX15_004766 [Streptoalloteichus tenebrarius]|uniref:Uncharacterized protein n=1 Tax=Streptoalloteichus tenebrarius (strain ATCC 17920 / DSM 40477 / JCM 4838 / CBS 697.72 / NBRC 16177 / NCIMB 11028 / NRRL B-12390 / A12253. 1 / ISP 5477) TaxID=1933 RepID=A0ABT1HZY6_STRSD|nr:hypothetical protein [Streptoalloteichus tenebrarius]MCP2261046.1 hypothetical protein [Streptoalloteichus tenebrarius]BFF03160.1 hypothetical protein GCM10020241_48350 [Streptoalloteichus tenebrarius]
MAWSYWHRVELYRVVRGQRVLEHVEEIDDHGPYVARGAKEYALTVAEDYLGRWGRPAGRRLVAVWRLDEGRKTKRLCEVELNWAGVAPSAPTGTETGRRGRNETSVIVTIGV